MDHTWEQLGALARAHGRRRAAAMLQEMVASQGDKKSWNAQQKRLLEVLKNKP
jgi:hypothetical protein